MNAMQPPNHEKEHANFEYYDLHCPEGKIELVDGRVIVGNSLDGSRLLFDHILRGWSLDAATALGSIELWIAALREVYGPITDLNHEPTRGEWSAPDVTSGGEGPDAGHRRVREHLSMSFFEVGEELGGEALGRIVMRLANNGFTPDTMFFKNAGQNTLHEYYLEGPAEMVIEVVRPAHRDYDDRVKRNYYARGGVAEYLIVDPERRHFEFLRLVNGSYVAQHSDSAGLYRPSSILGLAIQTEYLWPKGKYLGTRDEHRPFIVEQSQWAGKRKPPIDDGLSGGDLPFEPHLDLQSVPIKFEEYISWSPEAKFEFWDGRIQISGEEGVRNTTGLLLATLGLVEACHFAPLEAWLAALRRRCDREAHDQDIRAEWRKRATKAAELLRAKYHLERIAITGSLLSPKLLSFWSQSALAVWGVSFEQMQQIYKEVSAMNIDVFEADDHWFQQRLNTDEFRLEDL